ncbi:MAG: hypothetical protein ABI775_01940 [Pseudonocardiales bacterium]
MTSEFEDRLARALADTALASVPDQRARLPYATLAGARDRKPATLRIRWVRPMLAAAAVLTIVTTMTMLTVVADRTQDRAGRAGGASLASPQPTGRGSSANGSTNPSATGATPTSLANVPGTRSLSALGLTFRVPIHWALRTAAPGQARQSSAACISGLPGSGCVLNVLRNDNVSAPLDPDAPASWAASPNCPSATLTAFSIQTLGVRGMEYRRFAACGSNAATEQWTAPSNPQVVIWHVLGAHTDEVRTVLKTVQLPGSITPMRLRGSGQLDTVLVSGGAVTIGVRWVVYSPAGNLVAAENQVDGFGLPSGVEFACWLWKIPGHAIGEYCPASVLAAQAAKGAHPADGSLALGAVPIEARTDGYQIQRIVTRTPDKTEVIR